MPSLRIASWLLLLTCLPAQAVDPNLIQASRQLTISPHVVISTRTVNGGRLCDGGTRWRYELGNSEIQVLSILWLRADPNVPPSGARNCAFCGSRLSS